LISFLLKIYIFGFLLLIYIHLDLKLNGLSGFKIDLVAEIRFFIKIEELYAAWHCCLAKETVCSRTETAIQAHIYWTLHFFSDICEEYLKFI